MFTFIESTAFERVRGLYLDDDDYAELQQFMMQNPEAGNVIRGSGVSENCAGVAKAGQTWRAARDLLRSVSAK